MNSLGLVTEAQARGYYCGCIIKNLHSNVCAYSQTCILEIQTTVRILLSTTLVPPKTTHIQLGQDYMQHVRQEGVNGKTLR